MEEQRRNDRGSSGIESSKQILLRPPDGFRQVDRTWREIDARRSVAEVAKTFQQSPLPSSQFDDWMLSIQFGKLSFDPPKISHERVDQPQIEAAPSCGGIIRRERVQNFGLNGTS